MNKNKRVVVFISVLFIVFMSINSVVAVELGDNLTSDGSVNVDFPQNESVIGENMFADSEDNLNTHEYFNNSSSNYNTINKNNILGASSIDDILRVGNTWYVSLNGHDRPEPQFGSFHHPFVTLEYALKRASNGDTIYFMGGTYNDYKWFSFNSNINIDINKAVNILAYNGEEVIMDGTNRYSIWSVSANNVNISGITFKNGISPSGGSALHLKNSNRNIRQDLEELQLKKLKATVKRAFEKIPYYNKKYSEAEVYPEDIQTLKDIEKIPYITKDDLRESYPFGLFAVDMSEIKELHSSSGTTGKPVVSGYTEKDLDTWAETIARGLTMMGIGENDILQNTHGYGMFTGGFGVHYGSHKVGAAIIPISTGQTRRQIEIMSDFGTTGLIFTPSYGIHLAEVALEDGIDPKELGIKAIGFGAEGWTEEIRQRVEELFGAKAYNIYGLTELMGPGVGVECSQQEGLHVAEDIYYPEIIDPNTEKVLGENQPGELVLTNLEREGMPVIRFRTKDLTKITYEKCGCGRTHGRINRITGRSDDMIKVKGVAIFPSQIEKALLKVGDAEPHYMIIVTRPETLDEIEVKVEASKDIFFDGVKEMMAIQTKIAKSIENETGIRMKITLVEPKTLPRFEGKAKRVIDKRNLH